jgi:transposase-like protein
MSQIRQIGGKRHFSPDQKLQVVLESLQEQTTIESVCRKYNIHASQINRWRQHFRENGASIFIDCRNTKNRNLRQGFKPGESPQELKNIIGELTVQNEILKKVSGLLH